MRESPSPFHQGEIEIQRRAGVAEEAKVVGRIIAATIPRGAIAFLKAQRLAVAASLDAEGRVWASLLAGPPGFLEVVDDRRLRLRAKPAPGDPLADNLATRPEIGLLVIDPRTRGRMRFSGRALRQAEGIFVMTDQVYGNCPKYIRVRRLVADDVAVPPGEPRHADRLGPEAQRTIAAADTFFIASAHPEAGADASHRGGRPGFVRLLDARRLRFPDYPGNNMFNTLGNLHANPRAGLLFVDFETGDLVSMTGRAAVRADRSVEFEAEAVLEMPGGSPQRWSSREAGPGISRDVAGEGPAEEERE